MKLRHRDFTLDGPGVVKLTPENPEDLWFSYNLIAKGDRLSAATIRKVQKETSSGSKEAQRVHTRLEIAVEAIDYDNVANVLRIRGKNVGENEHVKLGAYHTLEIDQQRPFTLAKDCWDSIAIDTLKVAYDPAATAEVAALMIQEGLAYVCLVGQSVTTTKTKIEASIPRKHGPAIAGYDKAINKFLENVLQAVSRHIDFNVVRCLIIAGPGFTKDQLHSHMLSEATKRELRTIIDNKSKIVLVHASSGYKHALKEVLSAPSVMSLIMDTKAAKEVRVLKDFFDMLSNDPSRAIYGPKEVDVAQDRLAIQILLLTDELFRNADISTRRKYVDLTNLVKASGGEVHVFSSMHVSGEQLAQLSGIAAILRFPLPDLEDMDL
ncbi:hypothetical protein GOP47_0016380 [Adiantum capillus-veneris]|uniref:Protein pelota homolog n=1 Tax=Adiantum capillus-veneris TaxID=13818 RepID=A0A9D4ZC07_ADICA|nr:hypothetical protein GOP47_0016380 [Adiantum capillus-veneris]